METTKQTILNDIEVFNDRIQIAQEKLDALPSCVTGWKARKRVKRTRQALANEIEHFKRLVGYAFMTACHKADIPYGLKTPDGVTFHTTRHTFGSWLAMRGVPIKTIQELMGHRIISMTMRYAHLTEDVKKEAVNVLNGLTNAKNRDCHKTVTNSDSDSPSKNQPTEIMTNI